MLTEERLKGRPVIGILGNRIPNEHRLFAGSERDYVNHDYVSAVEKAGGIPLILPITESIDTVVSALGLIDGLLISGGYDIHPSFYGEEPERRLGYTDQHIDRVQLACVRSAVKARRPVLGICRGLQVMNIALGGSLHQDTSIVSEGILQHMQDAHRWESAHTVRISANSRLSRIFGESCRVNSFHHQYIKDLGPGLIQTATAPDGVIEALESEDEEYFFIGVQWHPEMMLAGDDVMLPLFSAFTREASLES